jgi:hypothetical protein
MTAEVETKLSSETHVNKQRLGGEVFSLYVRDIGEERTNDSEDQNSFK